MPKISRAFFFAIVVILFISLRGFIGILFQEKGADLSVPFSGSRLFLPVDRKVSTTIVRLHGSQGGGNMQASSETEALVEQGFAVLQFCYFDCDQKEPKKNRDLFDIEINYILSALRWIRSQSFSDQKIVLYGFSRGAELALIIGALAKDPIEKPDAIVVHAPSEIVRGPWSPRWTKSECWICAKAPCVPGKKEQFVWSPHCGPLDPQKIDLNRSAWIFSGKIIPLNQRIEIERFRGPIFMSVGKKDQLWPYEQTVRIESLLRSKGISPEVHYFEDQGHVFSGTAELDRQRMVKDFLKKNYP